jgi:RsiW-degrading membrane proteinase PrsW (M82 family)
MNPILEYEKTMNTSPLSSARQPDDTRASMAFRVLVAVVTCLLVVLGLISIQNGAAAEPLAWAAGLLVGGCVFVLADILLAFLVVAIPPGLFVLSLAGLLAR